MAIYEDTSKRQRFQDEAEKVGHGPCLLAIYRLAMFVRAGGPKCCSVHIRSMKKNDV